MSISPLSDSKYFEVTSLVDSGNELLIEIYRAQATGSLLSDHQMMMCTPFA